MSRARELIGGVEEPILGGGVSQLVDLSGSMTWPRHRRIKAGSARHRRRGNDGASASLVITRQGGVTLGRVDVG